MIWGATLTDLRIILIQLINLWILFVVYSVILSFYSGNLRSYLNFFYLPISASKMILRYHRLLVSESKSSPLLFDKIVRLSLVASQTFSFYFTEIILFLFLPLIFQKFTGFIQLSLPQWTDKYVNYFVSSHDDATIPPLEVDRTAKIPDQSEENDLPKQDLNDQLVYDPSLGVITKGLQEMWNQQEAERAEILKRAKSRKKNKPLPPVRS